MFSRCEYVLERRHGNIVQEKLGPWKHGFQRGKVTAYMTFVLTQLMEKHWEYARPMYLAFLDQEKAFDRVPRNKIGNAMDEYEIPSELKRAIISKYGTCQSKVRVGAGDGEWFDSITGVRQGSILFPLLFIIHGLGDQRSGHNQRTSQLH